MLDANCLSIYYDLLIDFIDAYCAYSCAAVSTTSVFI